MTGVVVVGMHRSGTSAVTRVINLLGVSLGRADDLYSAPDNPSGHWESRSLCDLNDTILRAFGGWDMAPPTLPRHWLSSRRSEAFGPVMRATFADVYAADQWVWKDPRLCLTLPLWRQVLPGFCAILVLRAAAPVTRSLHKREDSGYPLGYCRALWDRYNRSAVAALEGLPVVVVDYDALCSDPLPEVCLLAERLTDLGVDVTDVESDAAASIQHLARPRERAVEGFGVDLFHALRALPASSSAFSPPSLPPEPRWVAPALAGGRSWLRVREWRVDHTGAIPWRTPTTFGN